MKNIKLIAVILIGLLCAIPSSVVAANGYTLETDLVEYTNNEDVIFTITSGSNIDQSTTFIIYINGNIVSLSPTNTTTNSYEYVISSELLKSGNNVIEAMTSSYIYCGTTNIIYNKYTYVTVDWDNLVQEYSKNSLLPSITFLLDDNSVIELDYSLYDEFSNTEFVDAGIYNLFLELSDSNYIVNNTSDLENIFEITTKDIDVSVTLDNEYTYGDYIYIEVLLEEDIDISALEFEVKINNNLVEGYTINKEDNNLYTIVIDSTNKDLEVSTNNDMELSIMFNNDNYNDISLFYSNLTLYPLEIDFNILSEDLVYTGDLLKPEIELIGVLEDDIVNYDITGYSEVGTYLLNISLDNEYYKVLTNEYEFNIIEDDVLERLAFDESNISDEVVIVNPQTNDNIIFIVGLSIISLCAIIVVCIKIKRN